MENLYFYPTLTEELRERAGFTISAFGFSYFYDDEYRDLMQKGKNTVTSKAIRRNLIKIFPIVGKEFKIHIIKNGVSEVVDCVEKDFVSQLSNIVILGNEFKPMASLFHPIRQDRFGDLCYIEDEKVIPIEMVNNQGEKGNYELKIKGWIGAYKTTRNRKAEISDFPDNYISLYANGKMGEFNILPLVGKGDAHFGYRMRDEIIFYMLYKLCLEKANAESTWHYRSGDPEDWNNMLYDIYKTANNTEKQIAQAKKLLLMGNEKFWGVLKQIYKECGVWNENYGSLLDELKDSKRTVCYRSILISENEKKRLLDDVMENPYDLFYYGKYLVKEYPEQVYELCYKEISESCAQAKDRREYKKITKNIAQLIKWKGNDTAKFLIEELKQRYPRKPALLDELEKVEKKL